MFDLIKFELEFIFDSIVLISARVSKINNPNDFVSSPDGITLLDSIAMRLQSIGETVKKIHKRDNNLLQNYPDIEWQEIIKMRDLISHHYNDIDNEIVYDICINKLPELKTTVEKIIKDLKK